MAGKTGPRTMGVVNANHAQSGKSFFSPFCIVHLLTLFSDVPDTEEKK